MYMQMRTKIATDSLEVHMAIPEEVWRIPLRILLTVVLALLLYLGLKVAFLLFQVRKYVLQEYF